MYTRAVALIRYTGALSRFIKVLHKVSFNTNQRSVSGTGAPIRYVLEPSAFYQGIAKGTGAAIQRLSMACRSRPAAGGLPSCGRQGRTRRPRPEKFNIDQHMTI